MSQMGGLFGWLILWTVAIGLGNFVIKWLNKNYGKQISSTDQGKKVWKTIMGIVIRKHKYIGIIAIVFLLVHMVIQFSKFGYNITGIMAAVLLITQGLLGMYSIILKKKRKGLWFIFHRVVAVLLVAVIGLHLVAPYTLNSLASSGNNTNTSTANVSSDASQVFTIDELATYNGQNGQPAYVAYKGIVYDVTNVDAWKNGSHNGQKAGTDLTNSISKSPHGDSVFADLTQVGTLSD